MPAGGNISRFSSTQVMYRARAMKLLRKPLFLTRFGMLAERVTRAFWPLWSWGFVLWAALSFDLPALAGPRIAPLLLAGAALVAVLLALRGLARFRWPRREAALERLDRALRGRPLTALWDSQGLGADDRGATALWRAHVARMAERAAAAPPVPPDLRLSDRDPLALRYVAATALVMALLFAPSDPKSGLSRALNPPAPAIAATGPAWEGWIEPPRYTGLPVIYLNEAPRDAPLPVPEGSRVTLRLYFEAGELQLRQSVAPPAPGRDAAALEEDARRPEQDFTIARSGEIALLDDGGDSRARWQIAMTPDTPPEIDLTAPVERTPDGEMRLEFAARDDYGITGGSALLTLDLDSVDRRYGLALPPEERPAIALDLPLPFSGALTDFTETLTEDLAQHPWAGLPVVLGLSVRDAKGQEGAAPDEPVILPGRRFFDPMAAAVAEQRRDLLWNRENGRRVARVLRAVSYLPEDIFDNERAYLLLRSAIRRLESHPDGRLDAARRDEVAEMLWRVAMLLEEGDLSDAEKRLRRAEERLSEALKNGATEEEIARLSEELRRAMQDYMEKLAREAEQNPDEQERRAGEMREITADQLQQMLDRIEELSRQGRNEEAQQLLEQLRQMMRQMQTARRQPGEGPGQQMMRNMQDTLRQQQQLSDESFRRLQEQFNGQRQQGQAPNGGRPGQGMQDDGTPRPGTPGAQELARRQEALRQLLESQRRNLPGAEGEDGRAAREALRRAERDMARSRDALREGDLPGALDEQAEALESLREGLENLGRELARNQNNEIGRQGDQAGSPDPGRRRDPLGREVGTVGRLDSGENMLNGQDPYMRSQELREEIRRRSGDQSRPKLERDYLKRLLDRF